MVKDRVSTFDPFHSMATCQAPGIDAAAVPAMLSPPEKHHAPADVKGFHVVVM